MSADATAHRIATRQHGLVTREQLRRAGLSDDGIRRRVRSGRLVRAAPAVFAMPGTPRTWEHTVLLAVLASGPSAVASHRSAAHLLGLDGCARPSDRPEVTVVRPSRGHRGLAHVHETVRRRAGETTVVDGIPTTRVERTLLDLAGVVATPVLEAALDGALRDGRTVPRRLLDLLGSAAPRGVAGAATLRSLLADDRPESWLERALLALVASAGLPRPELQRVVHDRAGRVARVDVAFAGGRVVVEVNGHRTHSTRRQRQRDHERANRMGLLGIVVLQFTYEDVTERPAHVVSLIASALESTNLRQDPAESA